MSLNKNTFEEAKKNASKRISEWIDETKSAGIVRLQDQYSKTFKRIEWKPKQENVKIQDTWKKSEKGKSDKSKEEKQKSDVKNTGKRDVKPNVNNKTKTGKEEKSSTKNSKKSSANLSSKKEGKSSGTKNSDKKDKDGNKPKAAKNTESRAESRMDRNTESRAERNTESRTSRASRGSKNKVYRDSANLLYGDNRNNRSSLFSSCERRSRSSIDAISLLFDGESDANECETPKRERPVIISIQSNDLSSKKCVPNSKSPESKQQKFTGVSKKKTTEKNVNKTPYLGTKKFKRKRTKQVKAVDDIDDEPTFNVATVEIHGNLSYLHSDYGLLRNPSRLLQHSRSNQNVELRVPSMSAGLTLSAKSRENLGLLRSPSNMLKGVSSEFFPVNRQLKKLIKFKECQDFQSDPGDHEGVQ
ncbi:hypothetical protein KUTeg_024298 [Tegillarca granosa]|uniref:Uncharacterized protein n=1 Tax=Tegillarca granosa TaxID=220873 RepID=A0ABQ9E1J2_TEGGR|nr:hypothetical protein KUTeg_024298 [Tegillarca granosa]